jgi:hypothetical protein
MAATALITLGAAGCSGIHLMDLGNPAPTAVSANEPLASDPASGSGSVTGSIAQSASLAYGATDHSDWDLIRRTVVASLSMPPTAHVEWSNHTTGDSGTISDLTVASAAKGRECRAFASTIAAVDGVHLYRAEICKGIMNTWEFAKIAAADAP